MKFNSKRKIIAYYVICLGVIALGWWGLMEKGRRNLADEGKISEIGEKIQEKTRFYLKIGGFLEENIKKTKISVFSNPKLSINLNQN